MASRRPIVLLVGWIAWSFAGPPLAAAQVRPSVAGPEGGRVTALIAPAEAPHLVYAATAGGGVFRSDDGGVSWHSSRRGLSEPEVLSLGIDPEDANHLYAGTLHGLFHSTDGAAAWQPVSDDLADLRIKTVLVLERGEVWVGTSTRGVLRRGPGQDRFEPRGDPAGAPVFALLAAGPGHLWAGTAHGLFETFDSGRSWIDRSQGLPSRFVKGLALDPRTHDVLWAGTGAGLAVSRDEGRTWAAVEGFPAVETRALAFSAPGRIQAATADGVLASSDAGESWAATTRPGHPDVAALVDLHRDTWLAGTADGVFTTSDGGQTWRERNRGLVATSITTLTRDAEEPTSLYAGTSTGRVFRSRDAGRSWRPLATRPDVGPVTALLHLPATDATPARLLAGVGSRLWATTPEGAWSPRGRHLPSGRISALAIHPEARHRLFAAVVGEGVFESRDAGRSWQEFRQRLEDRVVRDLAVDGDGSLFAATSSGLFLRPADSGGWEHRSVGSPAGLAAVTVGSTPGRLFVGTLGGEIYVSDDGGGSFRPRGRLPGVLHRLAAATTRQGNTVYAATSEGVYQGFDDSPWIPVAGTVGTPAQCLEVGPEGSPARVLTGTHGRGVVAGRGLRGPVTDLSRSPLRATPPRYTPEAAWIPGERDFP